MPEHDVQTPRIRLKDPLLGFGVFAGAVLALLHYAGPFVGILDFTVQAQFVKGAFLGVMFGGLLSAVREWRKAVKRPPAIDSDSADRGLPAIIGASVLVALGIFALWVRSLGLGDLAVTAVGGGILGVGVALLALEWGVAYSLVSPPETLAKASLSFLITTVLFFAVDALSFGAAPFIAVAVEFAVSSYLLTLVGRVSPPPQDAQAMNGGVSITLRSLFGTLWNPAVGALLCTFIFGLVWDPVLAERGGHISIWPDWEFFFGPLAASFVVILFFRKKSKEALEVFYRVVLPVAVALLLALPVVVTSSSAIALTIRTAEQFGFAIVALAIWDSMSVASSKLGLSPRFIFSLGVSVFSASALLGLASIPYLGTNGRWVCLLLLTVYLALIAVEFGRNAKRSSEELLAEKRGGEEYLQTRCLALAAQYGLSPRETEVFALLARGHSYVHIAKNLFLSENTVRTHAHHIYQKLNVCSREAMFAMVDSEHESVA